MKNKKDMKRILEMEPAVPRRYPNERPRVECLAILCDYNEQSQLLGRARCLAKNKFFPLWVATPVGPNFRVPEIMKWERLNP